MSDADRSATPPSAQEGAYAPVTRRVRAAFDGLMATASRAPRLTGAPAAPMRRALGRLVATSQGRDIFDQRMSHIEEAMARGRDLDQAGRAAVQRVGARLLADLAGVVEGAADDAADAGLAIADLAEESTGEAAEELARFGEAVEAASDALSDAAGELTRIAAAEGARIDGAIGPDALRGVDLGWMMALYTMEEERRSHQTAMAGALAS